MTSLVHFLALCVGKVGLAGNPCRINYKERREEKKEQKEKTLAEGGKVFDLIQFAKN